MLHDLVVDTNVFVHAHNRNVGLRHHEARKLALQLLDPDSATVLRVDPGFSADPSSNTSRIGSEYLNHLVPGMLGHQVVQTLAASMRVRPVPLLADGDERADVHQLVSDRRDRVFLQVALGSRSRVLASHDDAAFPDDVRSICRTRWGVVVGDAFEVVQLM
jgi:hypothetical protein